MKYGVVTHLGVHEINSALIDWPSVIVSVGLWNKTWSGFGTPENFNVLPPTSVPVTTRSLIAPSLATVVLFVDV